MSKLHEVYAHLMKHPDDVSLGGIKLYHSDVYYVRVHLEEKFQRNFSLEEVETLLIEEGLINNNKEKEEDEEI